MSEQLQQFFRVIPKLVRPVSLCTALALSLCLSLATTADEPKSVVVASKAFTESVVLMELMAQVIEEHTDIEVIRRPNISGSQLTFTAILADEIDIYAEYTGTAWFNQMGMKRQCVALECFTLFEQAGREKWELEILPPFGFNNTYAIAVRKETADEFNLKNISDLHRIGDSFSMAFSHEFLERPDGWRGLSSTYNLENIKPVGVEHSIVYPALEAGTVDASEVYSTDGKLENPYLVLLQDDRLYFPPYHAVPVIRKEIADKYPQVLRALGLLSWQIDEAEMRRLNKKAEDTQGNYAAVASEFLMSKGFISAGELADLDASFGSESSLDYELILTQTIRHTSLVFWSVFLACCLAIPLAIVLVFQPQWAGFCIGVTSVLQTIPSLALLALLVSIIGLGSATALFSIWLYALMPILRNTYVGLTEMDPELMDTALAMGMNRWQQMVKVRLPMASATIMAGIRTASVISVGVAALAAFVGAGGLGELMITGMQLTNEKLILAGAIPAAILALFFDGLLSILQKLLTPKALTLGRESNQMAGA